MDPVKFRVALPAADPPDNAQAFWASPQTSPFAFPATPAAQSHADFS